MDKIHIIMEWNNILKVKFSQLSKTNYEETLQICLNAYFRRMREEKVTCYRSL